MTTVADVTAKVTAVIKTFERPKSLRRLVASIREYYPELHTIVADDSKVPQPLDGVEYHILPFDVGVSAGRNYLVRQVRTPYLLLLDDDFYFTKETRIEKLLEVLEATDIDIVGGRTKRKRSVQSFHGLLTRKGTTLCHRRGYLEKCGDYLLCDIVSNFFLARTGTLREYGWDDELKVAEHYDFFWRHKGKIKVALHKDVFIAHAGGGGKLYRRYRGRHARYRRLFFKKNGLSRRVRLFRLTDR